MAGMAGFHSTPSQGVVLYLGSSLWMGGGSSGGLVPG
jgi:hypothetical protein